MKHASEKRQLQTLYPQITTSLQSYKFKLQNLQKPSLRYPCYANMPLRLLSRQQEMETQDSSGTCMQAWVCTSGSVDQRDQNR